MVLFHKHQQKITTDKVAHHFCMCSIGKTHIQEHHILQFSCLYQELVKIPILSIHTIKSEWSSAFRVNMTLTFSSSLYLPGKAAQLLWLHLKSVAISLNTEHRIKHSQNISCKSSHHHLLHFNAITITTVIAVCHCIFKHNTELYYTNWKQYVSTACKSASIPSVFYVQNHVNQCSAA